MSSFASIDRSKLFRACQHTIAQVYKERAYLKEKYIDETMELLNEKRKKWSWFGVKPLTREETEHIVKTERDGFGFLNHMKYYYYDDWGRDVVAVARRLMTLIESTDNTYINLSSKDAQLLDWPEDGETK